MNNQDLEEWNEICQANLNAWIAWFNYVESQEA